MKFLFSFICVCIFALIGVEAILDDFYCGDVSCYEVLSVPKTAKPKEIQKAYRSKSKLLHPDIRNKETDAEKKKQMEDDYLLLNKAYNVLKSIEERKQYDILLADPFLYKVMKRKYYGGGKNVYVHPLVPVILVLVVGSIVQKIHRESMMSKEKQRCIRNIVSNEKWIETTAAIFAKKGIEEEMAALKTANPREWETKALELNPVEMVLRIAPVKNDEIFAVQVIKFPYTFVLFILSFMREYKTNDQKLTRADKVTKTANALGLSEAQLIQRSDPASLSDGDYLGELDALLKRKLWKPKCMAAYKEELMQKRLKKIPKHRRSLVRQEIEQSEQNSREEAMKAHIKANFAMQ